MLKVWRYLLVLLLLSLTVTALSSESTRYHKKVFVNPKGKLVAEGTFQKYLGHYLFVLGNHDLIKTKSRDGYIIEYLANKTSYYVVYNDNGTVRELGEKGEKASEISHIYRYNKKGFIKHVDHFYVKEDRKSFKYYPNTKTIYHYDNQNRVLKKETIDKSKKRVSETLFRYNAKGKLIKKESYSKGKQVYAVEYKYQNNKLIMKKLFNDKKLVKKTDYLYNSKVRLIKIAPKVYKISYFKTTAKKKVLKFFLPEGILSESQELDNNNEVIGVKGILPNIQSYITYHFTIKLSNNKIIATFKNFSVKGKIPLNTVKMTFTQTGREIKTEWYNQKGEELFRLIPKEIRFTQEFNILNLLNAERVIFGKVLTEKRDKIKNEIIVEIYNKSNKRNWCFFGNSYYFYLIQFSDQVKDFNKIQILKAGYKYETISFNINKNKTIVNLSPTYLKVALKKKSKLYLK